MNVSKRTRILLAVAAALAVLAYLVIVDMGVSAGRIHRGVEVKGIDVGGLTLIEANRKLTPIGTTWESESLVFTPEQGGFNCIVKVKRLGWSKRTFDTAESAFAVGRDGAPFGALWDRARAWAGGVSVEWFDSLDADKVAAFIDDCRQAASSTGVEVDGVALAEMLDEIVGSWPYEQTHELPTL